MTVGINAAEGDNKHPTVVVTVGDVSTTVKGIFQAQAKQVVALLAGRKDLTVSAMGAGARWAIVMKPLGVFDPPSSVGQAAAVVGSVAQYPPESTGTTVQRGTPQGTAAVLGYMRDGVLVSPDQRGGEAIESAGRRRGGRVAAHPLGFGGRRWCERGRGVAPGRGSR